MQFSAPYSTSTIRHEGLSIRIQSVLSLFHSSQAFGSDVDLLPKALPILVCILQSFYLFRFLSQNYLTFSGSLHISVFILQMPYLFWFVSYS